jgi:hypothetical protein
MRDAFDRNCAFGEPETPRLPIALIACAALLAFLVLGGPAHPERTQPASPATAPVARAPA